MYTMHLTYIYIYTHVYTYMYIWDGHDPWSKAPFFSPSAQGTGAINVPGAQAAGTASFGMSLKGKNGEPMVNIWLIYG